MTKRYRKPGAGKRAEVAESRALASVTPIHASPPIGREAPKPNAWLSQAYGAHSDINVGEVISTIRAAELGQTERWVDLTRRMLASDGHLASLYETRITSVAGARWQLSPGHTTAGQERIAEMAAEDCQRMLEGLGNTERLFADILDGWFTGWSVHEIIWQMHGAEVVPVDLVWLHPRRFRWTPEYAPLLWDNGRATSYAWAAGREDPAGGVLLTPNKYVTHVPRVLPNYPTTSGVALSVWRPWFRKLWAVRSWLAGAEIAGNPRLVGYYPNGTDATLRRDMEQALSGLSATGAAAVSIEAKIETLPVSAQGAGSVWAEQVRGCDAEMSKAILGSTLNVEVGDSGGNRALGESQFDVTIYPRLRRDARAMWSTIEHQLLRPFLYFNAHRYGGVMPPLPIGESVLVEGEVEIDQLAIDSGKVRVNQLLSSRGLDPLTPEEGGEDFVAPAAPSALPFDAPPVGGADAARPLASSRAKTRTLTAGRQVTRRRAGAGVTRTFGR